MSISGGLTVEGMKVKRVGKEGLKQEMGKGGVGERKNGGGLGGMGGGGGEVRSEIVGGVS